MKNSKLLHNTENFKIKLPNILRNSKTLNVSPLASGIRPMIPTIYAIFVFTIVLEILINVIRQRKMESSRQERRKEAKKGKKKKQKQI